MKLLCSLLVASLALAADLPSGDSLLDRSIERSGGADAYAKAGSVVMTGTVEIVGHNISGSVSIYQQGEKSYTVIDLPGIGKAEEGFDGDVAWEANALQGARIKDGAEKAAFVRMSRANLLSSWRKYYKTARTLDAEDVEGKPAWKVELTPNDGPPEMFYFDRESSLLVRVTQTMATAMRDIMFDAFMSDYRLTDGIRTPFLLTEKVIGQTLAMHFDKASYTTALPDDRFDLPAPVKALVEKRKQPAQ